MDNKKVVEADEMVGKIRAAAAARSQSLFILARTDALAPEGIDSALRRGEKYLKAGADGVYVEGPETTEQLAKIGKTFKGVPLATSVLENGGKTPWLSPKEFGKLGFTMVLYPTTVLFRAAYAIDRAVRNLRQGKPIEKELAVDMGEFEEIVDLPYWQKLERTSGG